MHSYRRHTLAISPPRNLRFSSTRAHLYEDSKAITTDTVWSRKVKLSPQRRTKAASMDLTLMLRLVSALKKTTVRPIYAQ